MSKALFLVVIAYDIADNRARTRVAKLLEERMLRVQNSVYEGWMSRRAARTLGRRAAAHIAASDSLRVYTLRGQDAEQVQAWGFPPAPEQGDFLLF